MADNYLFTQGSSLTAAADDIGGVLWPRCKLGWGVDGSATDVSTAAPFPVTAAHQSDAVMVGTTAVTPAFATITANTSGATTIVSTTTSGGSRIRVLAWDLTVNSAVNFAWGSGSSAVLVTGLYYTGGQGGGVARSYNPVGYFQSSADAELVLYLESAVAVGGALTYILV